MLSSTLFKRNVSDFTETKSDETTSGKIQDGCLGAVQVRGEHVAWMLSEGISGLNSDV